MTKIKNKIAYPLDIVITDEDYVIGSDAETLGKVTKNYSVGALREYIAQGLSPEAGGTLKFREIAYTGALGTPSEVVNELVPDLAILQYEVVIVSVNGEKYLLKLQNRSFGAGQDAISDTDFIKIIVNKNLGEGIKIYKGFNATTGNQEFNTISSPDFNIAIVDGEIVITNPSTSSIPALYVNDLYIPTYDDWVKAGGNLVSNPTFLYKGDGAFSKPYTNTIQYTSSTTRVITPDTAIQNGLDAYVGDTLVHTRKNPEKLGQQVLVQSNNIGYNYAGDFSYAGLMFKTEIGITGTTTDYVVDMDNTSYFDAENASVTIETDNNAVINFTQSLGFNNSGNTASSDTYSSGKTINLIGNGKVLSSYNGANVLTRYMLNGNGNNNDGNVHYNIKCEIQAFYQGVYHSKNKNKIDFYNLVQSGRYLGSVNVNLKAFHQTGGQIRFFEDGSIDVSSEVSSRTYGLTFEPTDNGIGYCSLLLEQSKIYYSCKYLFARLNNEDVNLEVRNSLGSGSTTFPLGSNTVIKGLFENLGVDKWEVLFKNNNFTFTGIDFDKVDLTIQNSISTINFIGNNIVESLVVWGSKEQAVLGGIPKNSVFLKRITITAGNFVVGQEYRIATITGTSFTLIGASSNTVGLYFTATGVGTTQGTVYLETREVIN